MILVGDLLVNMVYYIDWGKFICENVIINVNIKFVIKKFGGVFFFYQCYYKSVVGVQFFVIFGYVKNICVVIR